MNEIPRIHKRIGTEIAISSPNSDRTRCLIRYGQYLHLIRDTHDNILRAGLTFRQ